MIIQFDIEHVIVEQIAKTINASPFSLSAFSSFYDKGFKTVPLVQRVRQGKFQSISEFYIDEMKVFIGGSEFSLETIGKEVQELLSQEQNPSKITAAFEMLQLRKIKSSLFLSSGKGGITSSLFTPLGKCGSSWEIYDMDNLYKIYKEKKDRFNLPNQEERKRSPS